MNREDLPLDRDTGWQPPTEEEIQKRAYELHLQRLCHGPLDDWLEAEAELFLERSQRTD